MDETVIGLLAALDSIGIAAKEDRGEVFLKPTPPAALLADLKKHKAELAHALRARVARARQQEAIIRLAADRRAWIEENKRLGVYRGHE